MLIFPQAIFDGLTALFSCEPITYILSLMFLAIIIFILRMIFCRA